MGDPASRMSFAVDCMLGKAAKWLRVLGFDARYERFRALGELEFHIGEGRIPITRNRRWCGAPGVLCLSSNDPGEQLREIVARVGIDPREICLFHRCIVCNELLGAVRREEAVSRVPEYVFQMNAVFHGCPKCGRLYWPGSHPGRMADRLREILGWVI
jgi:hypothetical protein